MHLSLTLDWNTPKKVTALPTGALEFHDVAGLKGRPGIYLIESFDGPKVTQWYIGQAGGIGGRLAKYATGATKAAAPPGKNGPTEIRVGRAFSAALAAKQEVRYRTAFDGTLTIPERYVDDEGEPVELPAPLRWTGYRHMAEAAAIAYRAEMTHGSWEVCLNLLPPRKSTTYKARSPLDELVFEFPSDRELARRNLLAPISWIRKLLPL